MLEVDGLRKSFTVGRSTLPGRGRGGARLTALDGVHLQLAAGEIVGIAGESGSGKSPLAKCLVGLLRPDAGEVRSTSARQAEWDRDAPPCVRS